MINLDLYFSSTCKTLFLREIGTLDKYSEYLASEVQKAMVAKSFLSGKEIYLSSPYYPKNARFIALGEEVGEKKSNGTDRATIDINKIKDIDSLISAVSENLAYCGNSNIGNCIEIEKSDACNDASFILSSHQAIRSKQSAHCYGIRDCENVYGCMLVGEVKSAIRTQISFYSVRCFESYLLMNCSDIFCSFNCRNCHDTMFCFNQSSKRNAIGNNQLERTKYGELKKKLISEIADELEKNGKFPSLFELSSAERVTI